VLVNDPKFANRSETALPMAASHGALVVCECVIAEIRPAFDDTDIEEFLVDWNLEFSASTRASALLAGAMFASYLRRRRAGPMRVVADFLIGAHAALSADRLLARDRGYYRDYFKGLVVSTPLTCCLANYP